MPFNAAQFRASFDKPAQSNYFEVEITRLPKFINSVGIDKVVRNYNAALINKATNSFKFRCKATELPSKQLESIERRYHGPQRLVAYGSIFSTLNLEFIEDDNYSVRNLFETWQDFVFGGGDYRPSYYDDYIGEITLKVFTAEGRQVRSYIFTDAFPISLAPNQLAWENVDQFVIVPIEISYHEFVASSKEVAIKNPKSGGVGIEDITGSIKPPVIDHASFGSPLDGIKDIGSSVFNKAKGFFS